VPVTDAEPHCLIAVQTFTGSGLSGMLHCQTWTVPAAVAAEMTARLTDGYGEPVESLTPARVAYDSAQDAKKAGMAFRYPDRP
jgi:hypothetical protein